MRAAVYDGPGRFEVRDVPDAVCPPGGALLRVAACAVCGTDVRIVRYGHAQVTPPQVLGHEVAGTVVESDAPGVTVGARVQVTPAVGCGECRFCRAGRTNQCPGLQTIGYHSAGAFAPLLAVPAGAVLQGSLTSVPAELTATTACLAEPLACCLNGQELVAAGPGDRVVVVGAGPIGCLHARLAAARGASLVIVVEQRPERLEQAVARCVGLPVPGGPEAGRRVLELTDGGADVVLVAAPSAEAQAEALGWLARGGRLSFFGGLPPGSGPVALDTNRIHYHELRIAGAHASTPAQNRAALRLIAGGSVRVDDLITSVHDLEETPAAVAGVAAGRGLKAVVAIGL
ncbi:MAG: alcohol dehydrogenase catalytic domain-containing protein [Armatimonadetes bacterium]|nr:alcohol dehydrogenase catalytic domain-containing protein [Armatimonadota bacterium]